MNRALLEQAISTIGYYASVCGEDDQDTPAKQTIEALKAELAKHEPEQAALNWVNLQNAAAEIVRNKLIWKRFIDGTPLANDIACWMADFALEYAAPTEPNCKFPTCHSQEYQDKLVQEILEPEPVAEITGHSYSQTNRRISFLPAGYELPVGTKLYTKEREP